MPKKTKKGRPPKLNPICEKLRHFNNNSRLTYEMMCVRTQMKYPTFMNAFSRNRVSKHMQYALTLAGIINEDDLHEYNTWLRKQKKSASKPKKQSEGAKSHSE